MVGGHRWTFKAKFRARAYGWRGSKTAIARLKEAVSEIKAVNRTDPVAAGEGAIVLMERLWPTFQDIDTSSGALGTAVNATLEEIISILIAAPATPKVRAAWLERLYDAVQEDGVQYLYPAEQRWGEIAVYPELMNAYADLLLPLLRRVWCAEPADHYVHITGQTICLSCLLDAGARAVLPGARPGRPRHAVRADHRQHPMVLYAFRNGSQISDFSGLAVIGASRPAAATWFQQEDQKVVGWRSPRRHARCSSKVRNSGAGVSGAVPAARTAVGRFEPVRESGRDRARSR
jgi:hypothetical protein